MNMFRSAVFKLTAVYAAIVMSICIIFSAALYHVAAQELHTGIYNQYTRLYNVYQPFGLRQPRTTPSQEVATRAHHIFLQILYFNLIVLLLSVGTSYAVARRTLRPIEAAHDQQKRFTADVSHELRTPLTSLRMESEVALLDGSTATELRQTLRSNLEEVQHMETLINNLLLLSSMEADQLRSDFVPVAVSDMLVDAAASLSKLASTKHISIDHTVVAGSVMGDKASLTQLCTILIENAIKYSPPGGTVTIDSTESKTKLTLTIRDAGSGIPLADLPHVFDRFYRADSARTVSTESGGGTQGFGLGLSLAKLIADLHAAEIIITSTPNKGTEVAVLLPRLSVRPTQPPSNK